MEERPLHPLIKLLIVFLLLYSIWKFAILFDSESLLPIVLMTVLLLADTYNFEHTRLLYQGWIVLILILMYGVKAGAKTLVILGGNAWEIDSSRYYMDIFLFALGLILGIREYILIRKSEQN